MIAYVVLMVMIVSAVINAQRSNYLGIADPIGSRVLIGSRKWKEEENKRFQTTELPPLYIDGNLLSSILYPTSTTQRTKEIQPRPTENINKKTQQVQPGSIENLYLQILKDRTTRPTENIDKKNQQNQPKSIENINKQILMKNQSEFSTNSIQINQESDDWWRILANEQKPPLVQTVLYPGFYYP